MSDSLGKPPSVDLEIRRLVVRLVHPLEREILWFALVSALDLLLTFLLLNGDTGSGWVRFDESNFIARYFLHSWGYRGLAYFKLAMVAFVVAICQLIALKRVDVGRRVLRFASVIVGAVVVYSVVLMLRHS
jgi:Domain of unknown function (DUF5658)